MIMSKISVPLDAMNLLANVHTKTELGRLEEKLTKLQNQASSARPKMDYAFLNTFQHLKVTLITLSS
jgi:hypothetical protein